MISEKETMVLTRLDVGASAISQRQLATQTGFSVGLVNAIIKKLVRTGLVKMTGINRRHIRYLLTPAGFTEKTKRSFRYVADTIAHYQMLRGRMLEVLKDLEKRGYTRFVIHGDGEMRQLLEEILDMELFWTKRISSLHGVSDPSVAVLNLTDKSSVEEGGVSVDFLPLLSKLNE